jgi:hypothetical protein
LHDAFSPLRAPAFGEPARRCQFTAVMCRFDSVEAGFSGIYDSEAYMDLGQEN